LEIVEGIVARQQREPTKLTTSLQLQSSIQVKTPLNSRSAADSDALDTSEPCSKATTSSAESCDHALLGVHCECNDERHCQEAGAAMITDVSNPVLKATDACDTALLASQQEGNGDSQTEDKVSQLVTDVCQPDLRSGASWSALEHLSAALTGFEAALQPAEPPAIADNGELAGRRVASQQALPEHSNNHMGPET